MYIASQKKKENIAEYLLYMWQIEDIIRAYKLDLDAIKQNLIAKSNLEPEREAELIQWYEGLIEMMHMEDAQQTGHLQINKNVLINLNDLHKQLLFSQNYSEYSAAFYKALPFITELKAKQNTQDETDIEVAFSFIYVILMLKMKRQEITEGTQKVQEIIIQFLAQLSAKYKLQQEGKLELDLD